MKSITLGTLLVVVAALGGCESKSKNKPPPKIIETPLEGPISTPTPTPKATNKPTTTTPTQRLGVTRPHVTPTNRPTVSTPTVIPTPEIPSLEEISGFVRELELTEDTWESQGGVLFKPIPNSEDPLQAEGMHTNAALITKNELTTDIEMIIIRYGAVNPAEMELITRSGVDETSKYSVIMDLNLAPTGDRLIPRDIAIPVKIYADSDKFGIRSKTDNSINVHRIYVVNSIDDPRITHNWAHLINLEYPYFYDEVIKDKSLGDRRVFEEGVLLGRHETIYDEVGEISLNTGNVYLHPDPISNTKPFFFYLDCDPEYDKHTFRVSVTPEGGEYETNRENIDFSFEQIGGCKEKVELMVDLREFQFEEMRLSMHPLSSTDDEDAKKHLESLLRASPIIVNTIR